ncbi:MAG: glucose-1-phosphate thymidylyltransferase [Flammeovirgaceae bacterium]|jgi:glucose-1-phosphate thymidylyltransferase
MKIIVPMAGRGSRLRPHTLTVPKPLVKVVGKPIVQNLVEDLAEMCEEKVEEIAFIIGDFGKEVEVELLKIAENLGAKGTICYQDQPLGTAHAILCAGDSLDGNVIVAFADTLFKADFSIDKSKDGIVWVQQVEDPSRFGVVKYDDNQVITDFIEKPQEFVSDRAIIGIYYFNDGKYLRSELQKLIDDKVIVNGEYQLTDALENMKLAGQKFEIGTVGSWLDCGNKIATVDTNQRYMDFQKGKELVSKSAKITNSVLIEPVFIADGAEISNTVLGPHVSVGLNTKIANSVISNSIIQDNTQIERANIADSMVGSLVKYTGRAKDLSIGDFTEITE